jgi:anti-sigma factor RsiW
MTCEIWRDQIEMYVDGELASAHETEVARHLRSCPECTSFAAGAIHLKRGISLAARRYKPSAEFREQIANSLRSRKRFQFNKGWHLSFAALLLVALAVGTLTLSRRGTDVDRQIADIHLNTISSSNPVDVISTDQHTVKPWFQGKVPFTFNVPDLKNSPFTLVGGRVAYVNATPTALLLFQYKLHKISVLIGPQSSLGSSAESRQLPNGFHVVRAQKDGRTIVTIGDAELRIIEDLAKRVQAVE